MTNLSGYYNQYDPSLGYTRLLYRAGSVVQSQELNAAQEIPLHFLGQLGNALFSEGTILRGAGLVVDPSTGATICEAGEVYLAGLVQSVPQSTLTLPVTGTVVVGVYLKTDVVTELEDPALRDPAVGVRNYNGPGAARLRVSAVWGVFGDGQSGNFYAVHRVADGVIQITTPPPQMDSVQVALARYDREANGSYVVSGLGVRFLERDSTAGEQVFVLSSGVANVLGYKVNLLQDLRARFAADPDLQTVISEPHLFTDSGDGTMRVSINRAPLDSVSLISVTKERTVTLTHGVYTGATDTLPNATVVTVLEVKQGATTYTVGSDYTAVADTISWAPTGAEPAPGSSYTVKYTYIDSVVPSGVDDDGFTVSGIVPGTVLYVTYSWRMPRIDVLALNGQGELSRIKGVSRAIAPAAPTVPDSLLALASITHSWRTNTAPTLRNIAIQAIRMDQLEDMQSQIAELYFLTSTANLRADASTREAGALKGVFVDPFNDNSLRDAGILQTAAIAANMLTLPIAVEAVYMASDGPGTSFQTLDYSLSPALEQLARTGSMAINPYMAFNPLPAHVTLSPAIDEWATLVTVWDAATTVFVGSGNRSSSSTRVDLLSRTAIATTYLRELTVSFTVSGFDPYEALSSVRFDGVIVTPVLPVTADGMGSMTGSFVIPANIPVGTKSVEFLGAHGSYGMASFVGSGSITTEVRRRVTTVSSWWVSVDPLAQTFTLSEARTLRAVDLWFTAKGSDSDIIVQIRPTEQGFPSRDVLSEGRLQASEIVINGGATRVAIDPVVLEANREYALVFMSDAAAHALAVAQLGKYDSHTGSWVTTQPYQVGVLLSSSNASTWTAHQDQDLAFRLLSDSYTGTSKELVLGTYILVAGTDLIALAGVDRPSAGTDVVFEVSTGTSSYHLTEYQPLRLAETLSGPVTVKAVLSGGGNNSPVLYPNPKLMVGSLQSSGSYVGRAFPAAVSFNLTVVLEALVPVGASLSVYAESGSADNWAEVPFASGAAADDGYTERTYKAAGLTGIGADHTTRIKLVLTGAPAARPFVRKLRAVTL